VENCVRKKSYKKCRSELRSQFPRVSIGEQNSKKSFLGKGNRRAFITLSFRRDVRRCCSVFRNTFSKTFKTLIPQAVTKVLRWKPQNFAVMQKFLSLLRQYGFVNGSVEQCIVVKSNHC